ncbi:MAG: hypothetical protein PHE33_04890 [Bacteroidales bacterium]|nr:hypothetical protein [Bacteroidales bacterium]
MRTAFNKIFLVILINLFTGLANNSQAINLIGNIGGNEINMNITNPDYTTGEFKGGYFYLNDYDKHITFQIKGVNYGTLIYMEEFYSNNLSGKFYLEKISDYITGYWVFEEKSLPVQLEIVDNRRTFFVLKSLREYSLNTNNSVSGIYKFNYYFLNNYYVTAENPDYKIGFNGGILYVENIGENEIGFELEVICGMTYQRAFINGVATKIGNTYIYKAENDDDKQCEITFKFKRKYVFIKAENDNSCNFKEEVFLDHKLIKVRD